MQTLKINFAEIKTFMNIFQYDNLLPNKLIFSKLLRPFVYQIFKSKRIKYIFLITDNIYLFLIRLSSIKFV